MIVSGGLWGQNVGGGGRWRGPGSDEANCDWPAYCARVDAFVPILLGEGASECTARGSADEAAARWERRWRDPGPISELLHFLLQKARGEQEWEARKLRLYIGRAGERRIRQ